MSSGRRTRSARSRSPGLFPLAVPGLVSMVLLGGCAGGELVATRAAERQATLDRWGRCVDRRSGAAPLSEVRSRVVDGCEGHRRDVLRAFPPGMAPRLERLMDERTEVALRTRLRESGESTREDDPLLQRVLDAFSAD